MSGPEAKVYFSETDRGRENRVDQQTLGMIALLRSALNDEACALPEGFDLEQALPVLCRQSLAGLALRGAVRCGVPKTGKAFSRLIAVFRQEALVSGRQMQRIGELTALFDAHGLDLLFVKGAVMKPLYPQPELRVMGDADVLIREEQYPEIRRVLTENGWNNDGDCGYECQWSCDGLRIDVHRCLSKPEENLYYDYYRDGWRLAEKGPSGSLHHMRPEDHFIFMLIHFVRHYRGGVAPVKSICDFYVFYRAHPNMDQAYMEQELEKLRLLAFYRNILQLLDCWFRGAPFSAVAEQITVTALRGGIYGKEQSDVVSAAIRISDGESSMLRKKLRWFFWRVFPPASYLKHRYPALQKAPVLLPVFWAVRGWEIATHPERRDRAIESSRLMLETDEEKLTAYQEQLRGIGLDISELE
ncbi:MAG: hypothetical protein E7443_03955 [Ruminococcaceae bacterium]|nr:hypothetical protein [Oscillospiraceae bacterium]